MIDQLVYCISSYREAAMSCDPKFDHIDVSEKQKVRTGCSSLLPVCSSPSVSYLNLVLLFL